MADPEPQSEVPEQEGSRAVPLKAVVKGWLSAVVLILFAAAYNATAKDIQYPSPPDFQAQWKLKNATDSSWEPVFQNPDLASSGRYQQLDFYVAWYAQSRQDSKLISSVNQLYNRSSWTRTNSQAQPGYQLLEISSLDGRRRMLAYTYVTPWLQSPNDIKVRLTQALQAVAGQPQQGMVMVISKLVENVEDRKDFRQQAASFFSQNYQQTLND